MGGRVDWWMDGWMGGWVGLVGRGGKPHRLAKSLFLHEQRCLLRTQGAREHASGLREICIPIPL